MSFFRVDRDLVIFLILVLSVILLNVIPLPPAVRLALFILIVILQALFVYHGITRHRR